jgi:hypothetical protein
MNISDPLIALHYSLTDWLVNYCWSSPAEWFLVPNPQDSLPYLILWRLREPSEHCPAPILTTPLINQILKARTERYVEASPWRKGRKGYLQGPPGQATPYFIRTHENMAAFQLQHPGYKGLTISNYPSLLRGLLRCCNRPFISEILFAARVCHSRVLPPLPTLVSEWYRPYNIAHRILTVLTRTLKTQGRSGGWQSRRKSYLYWRFANQNSS